MVICGYDAKRGFHAYVLVVSPAIVAVVTFWTCYLLGIELNASNVFTFLATIRIIQEPIQAISDVAAVFIEGRVALTRVVEFLQAPELQKDGKNHGNMEDRAVVINCESISWNDDSSKPTLTDVKLEVLTGKKWLSAVKSALVNRLLSPPFLERFEYKRHSTTLLTF
ncbi:unnamed protein product [Lactuca virosa]|uniref:Uncharacterized protein n=1 Tax=Lactuca virosa TaxID=75947 RepID=A0AAU9PT92_9ASTR|nr:unnamed protein product [Lactuca virosa]